jgi:uncharacterized protein (DUF697 family)
MAKKKARPEFNLPSTEPKAGADTASEWVYRSDEEADPGDETDAFGETTNTLGRAKRIVIRYSRYAGAAGAIPIPAIDMVAVGGLQLKMIADLATNYGVEFNDQLGKSLLAAVIGSVSSTKIAYGFGGSMLKSIPIIGSIGGLLAMPAFAYAVTWAIGKVFVQHFETGGTLLDFNPEKMRAHFESEFAAAR